MEKAKQYRIPIKKFREVEANPQKGKKVILKTRLGKTVETKIVRIDRSTVTLEKVKQ